MRGKALKRRYELGPIGARLIWGDLYLVGQYRRNLWLLNAFSVRLQTKVMLDYRTTRLRRPPIGAFVGAPSRAKGHVTRLPQMRRSVLR
jgi:hypothetical protein